jgi:DNA polymerase III alpha subunit
VVFLLLEDEHGMINLILFPAVYDRFRLLARTESLLEVEGTLERRERNLNLIVERLAPLDQPGRPTVAPIALPVQRAGPPDERELAMAAGAEHADVQALRSVAPRGQHFGQGRR